MGTPLGLFTGAWFSLFGGAVLWWCAAEVRTRRTLRRVGVTGMARVVVDLDDESQDHADTAPLLSFQAEGHGEVVTRPRGWTSIRRAPALVADSLVPVSYDPAEPTLVVLDGTPQGRSDLFWLCLGLAFAACGVTLLAAAL